MINISHKLVVDINCAWYFTYCNTRTKIVNLNQLARMYSFTVKSFKKYINYNAKYVDILKIFDHRGRRLRVNRCHQGRQCRRCGGVRCQNTRENIFPFLDPQNDKKKTYSYDWFWTKTDDFENGPQKDGQLLTSE